MKRTLGRLAILVCSILATVPGWAQLTRNWQTVAATDGSVLGQVPAIGRMVEANPGNRGAFIAMSTANTTTMILSANGALQKVVYTAGNPVPIFSTPVISLSAGDIPRSIRLAPSGTLYMVANAGIDNTWPTSTPALAGHLYVSLDGGDTWTNVKAVSNAGYLAMYTKTQTGSSDNTAIRIGGLDVVSYEVMEFQGASASTNATAYATAGTVHVTGGSRDVYYGFKSIADGAGSTETGGSLMTRIGEIPISATGADLGYSAIRYRYKVWQVYCNNNAGYVEGRATPLFSNWLAQSATYVTGNDGNCGPTSGVQTGTNDVGMSLDCTGSHQTCFTNFPEGYYKGNNFSWVDGPHNVARFRSAVVTPDNGGLILGGYDQSGTGVKVYRGAFGSGGAAPSVVMNGGLFLTSPQEVFAGFNQFMAVVADSGGGSPSVYVSESTYPFQGGANMTQTTFGTGFTDRLAITSPTALNWTSSAADVSTWDGKLLAVEQDKWASGSPSATRFGLYVVPTTVAVSATVDGVTQSGTVLSGCSVSLNGTVTGEPGATAYYVWQTQNANGTWPSTASLGSFSTIQLDSTGHATLPSYSVPANGIYRLVAAGQMGGFVYDQTSTGYGVSSQNYTVTFKAVPSMNSPEILDSGAHVIGTTSATVCTGSNITLQVTLNNGSSAYVNWTVGGASVGTGTNLYVAPTSTTTYTASYTGTSCATVSPISFTVSVNPGLGSLSVVQTNGSGQPDGVDGCSGNLVNFAASAANATSYSWVEALSAGSGTGTFFPISNSSSLSIPRLASGPALNANPSFEGSTAGWEVGSWGSVAPPGGAANGANALNGTTAQAVRSTDFILVDTRMAYMYAAVAKNGAQAGTSMTMAIECYDNLKNPTAPATLSLPASTLTSAWTTSGAFIGNGSSYAFPAGTAYVKVRVAMPASAAPGAYLDAVRLIPVTSSDMALVNSYATGPDSNRYAQYWDTRVGLAADGFSTRTWNYQVTAANSCQSATSATLKINTNPHVFFVTHDAALNGVSILVPDPNPANPMTATICGAANLTLSAPTANSTAVANRWLTCTDYNPTNDSGSWVDASGSNANDSYSFSTPGTSTGSTTYFRLQVTGGCDGLSYFSRVFKVVQLAAPTVTSALTGTAQVCSGGTVTLNVGYINGSSISWEQAVNGGAWSAASPVPALQSQSGNNYTFTVLAPTTSGSDLQVSYRLRISANGCSDVYAPISAAVVVKDPASITSPAISVDGTAMNGATSATVCANQTITLAVTQVGAGSVAWTKNGAAYQSGASVTFQAVNAGTANITDTYVATVTGGCGVGNSITFTITTQPQLGALTVNRNPTGSVCSGGSVAFTAGANAATNYVWEVSPDGATFTTASTGTSSYTQNLLAPGPTLNQNPGFESGLTGWTTGSWAVVPVPGGAAEGGQGLNGTTAQDVRQNAYMLVDSRQAYAYLAVAKNGQAGTQMTMVLECYDGSKLPTTPASVAFPAATIASSWTTYGGFVGSGTTIPFPTNTQYVKIHLIMPASAAPGAYLDAVRFVPVSTAEMAMVNSTAPGADQWKYAQQWDAMGGRTNNGITTTSRVVRVTASNSCASQVSSPQTVTSSPQLWFSSQDVVDGSFNSILVPNNDPSKPLVATVCGATNLSLTAPATSDGTVNYLWQSCTDYNAGTNVGSWTAAGGTNSTSTYQVTTSGTGGVTTFYRVIATGGCDGLPHYSRVFQIVETLVPVVTSPLTGPATACSQSVVTLTVGYANATNVNWEQAVNGGPWTAASPAPSFQSQAGNNYTYTVQMPQVLVQSKQISYRLRLSAGGCADVYAPIGAAIVVSPEISYGAQTINGSPTATASMCPTDTATLDTGVTGATAYQWYTRPTGTSTWNVVTGETNAALQVLAPNQTMISSQQYMLRSFGACSTQMDSATFTLTFKAQAQISVQPTAPAQTCSGTMQPLSFGSAGATAFSWTETSSDGSPILSYPASSSIQVPAIASGAALNPDPSFELGISAVQRVDGQAGSSLAWDRTTPASFGNASIHTYGGAITIQHPAGTTLVPIDPTQPYIVVASGWSSGSLTGSIGVVSYDTNHTMINTQWLAGATSVALGANWSPFGALLDAGGSSTALPANAAYVQLLVRLNEGGTTQEGGLDNLRIIPLGSDELNVLNTAIPGGMTLAAFWDGRAGKDATGTVTRSFSYVGTAIAACGSVQTQVVTVNAVPKPFIVSQPADAQICGGQSTTIQASILGGGNISYQWQSSPDGTQWTAISGATNPTINYVAPAVTATTTIQLRLVGITTCGTVVTRTASITVYPAPTITTDLDVQASACAGDVVTLRFAGQGGTPVFEGSLDGGAWAAVTPALQADGTWTLAMPAVTKSSNYSLRVRMTTTTICSQAVSSTRVVAVNPLTAITTQPSSFTECLGSSQSLAVATAGSNLTYQWQVNTGAGWSNIPGAVSYSYIPVAPAGQTTDYQASYRVIINGDCGGGQTSSIAGVTMLATPRITTQPKGVTLATGQSANLSVVASGTGITYQWQSSSDGIVWSDVTGASGPSYTTGALTADAGTMTTSFYYRVAIGGTCSPVVSSTATVVVYPAIAANPAVNGPNPTCSGTPVPMAANVTSGAGVSIKWQLQQGTSWGDIAGAVGTSYSATATATGTSPVTLNYRPVITDPVGQVLYGSTLGVTWYPTPVFTQQPVGSTVCQGADVTLTAAYTIATGAGTPNWEVSTDGGLTYAPIAGATGSTLALTNLQSTGSYRIRISGACQDIMSSVAVVTVNPTNSLVVQTQPQGFTACQNGSYQPLTVAVSGTNPTYQWQVNTGAGWSNIPGANGISYLPAAPNGTTGDWSAQFRVIIGGACGNPVTSNSVSVTLLRPIQITAQPLGSPIGAGQSISLSVSATGTVSSYQWQQSNDNVIFTNVGVSSPTFTTPALPATGTNATNYYYRVVISAPAGTCDPITSQTTTVKVYPTPSVTVFNAQGTNSLCSGTSASLQASVSAGAELSYQWQVSTGGAWTNVVGANGYSYNPTQTASGGNSVYAQYRVVVNDPVGQTVTTSPIGLTWYPTPVFTQQPVSTTVCQGADVTLTAAYTIAAGAGTPNWEVSTDGGINYVAIAGATSPSLTLSNLQSTASYRIRIIGACQDVLSSVAVVTVNPNTLIKIQPVGGTYCAGDLIPLTVTAVGSNLHYVWEKNLGQGWVQIPGNGATNSMVAVNDGTTNLSMDLRVTITGDCGAPAVSTTATAIIKPALTFLTQPSPSTISICHDTSTTIGVTVRGATSLLWEVSSDGGASWASTNQTTATITTGVLPPGTYQYRVAATSSCGTIYSGVAVVTSKPQAAILSQPASQVICSGNQASLNIGTNLTDATYQWMVGTNAAGPFSVIAGASGAQYIPTAVTNVSAAPVVYYYQVQVIPNGCDQPMVSSVVSITTLPAPNFTTQPQPVDVCLNGSATMSAAVTGDKVSLAWQINDGSTTGWTFLSGATGTSVNLPTGTIGTYQVRAVASGTCGQVFSNTVTFHVGGPTAIQQSPQDATVCPGSSVTLNVQATGAQLTYRWERSSDGGATWSPVGTSSPSLTVIASTTAKYHVIVMGGGGCADSVTSSIATVTVNNVPQDVPLNVPTFALAGNPVYFSTAVGSPAYDTVTWTMGSQVQTGSSVVMQMPADPGTYKISVVASANGCQSATIWSITVITKGNGDYNQDNLIDGRDFARLEVCMGSKAGEAGYDASLDMNGDGVIDAADESLLLSQYAQVVGTPTIVSNQSGSATASFTLSHGDSHGTEVHPEAPVRLASAHRPAGVRGWRWWQQLEQPVTDDRLRALLHRAGPQRFGPGDPAEHVA